MTNASSSLAASGNSLEQSIALLTSANTTIQNASKSSTGLRTIAARLRNTKSDLEELGEEEMTTAQYQQIVNALTEQNVSLTDANGEFRSTYDILHDIAEVWDDLSSMEQSGLATTISGTRQQAVFFSIIEQFREAEGAMEAMANSQGELQQSYDIYMESTTAHINQFKVAFESLGSELFDSNLMTPFVDIGTAALSAVTQVVKLLNAIGGLKTVLLGAIAIVGAFKFEMVLNFLKSIPTMLFRVTDGVGKLAGAFRMAIQLGKMSGEASFFGKLTAGANGLNTALAAQNLTIKASGLAFGGLFAALSIGVGIYSAVKRHNEELRQSIDENAKSAKESSKSLEELIAKYDELAHKDLTPDEYETQAKQLQQEIADLIGVQGRTLDLVNGKYTEQLELLKQINSEHLKLTLPDLQNKAIQDLEDYKNGRIMEGDTQATSYADYTNDLKNLLNYFGYRDQPIEAKYGSFDFGSIDSVFNSRNIDDIYAALTRIRDYFTKDKDVIAKLSQLELNPESGVPLENPIESILSWIDTQIAYYESLQAEAKGSQQDYFNALAQTTWEKKQGEVDIHNQEGFNGLLQWAEGQAGVVRKDFGDEGVQMYAESLKELIRKTFPQYIDSSQGIIGANTKVASSVVDAADAMDALSSAYSALDKAREDMATTGTLSEETIASLAKENENYIDFLEVEAGQVKLNTKAWQEYANSKVNAKIGEFQSELYSKQDRNKNLQSQYGEYWDAKSQYESLLKAPASTTANTEYQSQLEAARARVEALEQQLGKTGAELQRFSQEFEENKKVIEDDAENIKILQALINQLQGQREFAYIDQISQADEGIKKLGEALGKFEEDGIFRASDFDGFTELFGHLDSYENFVKTITNSSSEYSDVKAAVNALGNEYINSIGILSDLNAGNKDVIESMLTSMGVTNAHEVVTQRLAAMELDAVFATIDLANASWTDVKAKLEEAGATEETIEAFQVYKAECIKAELAAFDFTSATAQNASALLQQAQCAGVVCGALAKLAKLEADFENGKLNMAQLNHLDDQRALLMQSAANEIQAMINNASVTVPKVSVDVPKVSTGSGNKDKGSSKDPTDPYIAEIEKFRIETEALKDVQKNKERLELKFDNSDLKERNEMMQELIDLDTEEQQRRVELVAARRSYIDENVKKLRGLGFDVLWDPENNRLLVKNMEHINDLMNKKVDPNHKYEDAQEAINDYRKDIEELIEEIEGFNEENQEDSQAWWDLFFDKRQREIELFDNLIKMEENQMSLLEHQLDKMQDRLYKNTHIHPEDIQKGLIGPTPEQPNPAWDRYNELIDKVHKAREELRAMQKEANASAAKTATTIYANISEDSRGPIVFDEERLKALKESFLKFFPDFFESSDVQSMTDEFANIFSEIKGFDNIPIAFSPVLTAADGTTTLLTADTLKKYLSQLMELASNGQDPATIEVEVLAKAIADLDTQGLTIDGQKIQGIISAIGASAKTVASDITNMGQNKALLDKQKEIVALTAEIDNLESSVMGLDKYNVFDAFAEINAQSNKIIEAERQIQQDAHEAAEALRAQGYDDSSDEIKEYTDQWWDAEDRIKEAQQSILDGIQEFRDKSNEILSDVKGAYDTFKDAANEYAENGGFLTIDTYQSIMELGPEYMSYLKTEGGLLQINEERVFDLIAAKTRQLALDQGIAYIERIRQAMQEGSIEDLHQVIDATTDATKANWGLLYSELQLLGLPEDLYKEAKFALDAMYSLGENAVGSIGRVGGEAKTQLEDDSDSIESLIDMVKDLITHEIEQMKKKLNDLKEAYSDIIDLKTKSLEKSEEELSYQKDISKKVKELSKLQEKLDALNLDDSRDAAAERKKLLEEMADLQEELDDTQREHSVDKQKESLDEMNDAYSKSKDKEIEELEKTVSSEEKLYELAIERITEAWQTDWEGLLEQLKADNYEYGSRLESEITTAWQSASDACTRYGMSATNTIDSIINKIKEQLKLMEEASKYNENITVGNDYSFPDSDGILSRTGDIIQDMKNNSASWFDATESERRLLDQDQFYLAGLLKKYGVTVERRSDGNWYIIEDKNINGGKNVGSKLYDIYKPGRFSYTPGEISDLYKPTTSTGSSSSTGSSGSTNKPSTSTSSSKKDTEQADAAVKDTVARMKEISGQWYQGISDAEFQKLNAKQQELVNRLTKHGVYVTRGSDGVWRITRDDNHPEYIGSNIYDVYKYHVGGIIGNAPGLKQNEVLATLQRGEVIIANKDKRKLFDVLRTASELSDTLSSSFNNGAANIFEQMNKMATKGIPDNVSNNSNSIHFGDIYITGTNEETVQKHKEISRKFTNEILSYLNLKK